MRQRLNSKIARRLVWYILACSTVITMFLTAIQLFRDYRIEVDNINIRMEHIGISDLSTLSEFIWVVDFDSVKTKVEGLLSLPDICYVRVNDESGDTVVAVGQQFDQDVISQQFQLNHFYRGKSYLIGELYVQTSLRGVYQRIWDKVVVILISQGTKTFLVSLFILLIVYWFLTRHLLAIANYVTVLDFHNKATHLQLDRKQNYWTRDDELMVVVDSLNAMHDKLWESYQEILAHQSGLERQVRQRTEQLQRKDSDISTFTYSVSHDIRAPLRSIFGFADALSEDYGKQLDENAQDYLSRIRNAALRMGDLIDDLLLLTRISQADMSLSDVDLGAQIDDIIESIGKSTPQRKIDWRIQSGIQVRADKKLIKIVFENLLGNAVKFTESRDPAIIEVECELRPDKQILSVRDNGVGFDMKYKDKLFTAFQRLHGLDFEGSGIGLATVQKIISRHGGKVWAQASPDTGATFFLSLPRTDADSIG